MESVHYSAGWYLLRHLKTFISSILDGPRPSLNGIEPHCPVRGDHLGEAGRGGGGGGGNSLKMTNVPIVDRIVKCNNQNGSNSRLERRGRFLSLSMWKMKQIPASNKNWSFVLFCIPCSDNLTTFFWRSAQLSLFCSIFLCQFMHPFLFACFHFCFFQFMLPFLFHSQNPLWASDLRECKHTVCKTCVNVNRSNLNVFRITI